MSKGQGSAGPVPQVCAWKEKGTRNLCAATSPRAAPCLGFPTCRAAMKQGGGGEVLEQSEGELPAAEIDREIFLQVLKAAPASS